MCVCVHTGLEGAMVMLPVTVLYNVKSEAVNILIPVLCGSVCVRVHVCA